jgi:RNA polymerase sigma factor (sigma-70 family)
VEKIDFDYIFSMYSRRLQYIAFSIIKDHFLAEDVVQETFLKVHKKIDTIDDPKKIAAWLLSITVRTAIDFLRKEKRMNWIITDQQIMENLFFHSGIGNSTEKEVEMRLFNHELECCLLNLSEEYKEVLKLRIQYGLREQEIACKLQLTASTVKNRLYRGRKQLIKVLTAKYAA